MKELLRNAMVDSIDVENAMLTYLRSRDRYPNP